MMIMQCLRKIHQIQYQRIPAREITVWGLLFQFIKYGITGYTNCLRIQGQLRYQTLIWRNYIVKS